MQDNVEIYTKALIQVIYDSREYREFVKAKKKVAGQPELKAQINQYRMDVYKLQNYCDAKDLFEQTEEFNRQHAQFRKNPLVDEYLRSELAVCRILQRVASEVVDSVDLDLDDIAGKIRL
ncbi:MAG: YlbF family regulator [Eubacteriales bacterium]|nr:YlbF family regulator [Eubacteriales bacterium]